jgi:hypothetical protein
MMRASQLWAAAAVVLGITAAGCGGGSRSPAVASVSSGPTTTVTKAGGSPTTTAAVRAGGSGSAGQTPLAKAEAYSHCMRNHGVPNWPDPVLTPSGGYGFRTVGIDPHSAAFQSATQACDALVPQGWSTGQQLSPAQQQAWLDWAKCIRSHGMQDFPDPKFSGGAVQISGGGSSSPQLTSAMDACKSQLPSSGGLGG